MTDASINFIAFYIDKHYSIGSWNYQSFVFNGKAIEHAFWALVMDAVDLVEIELFEVRSEDVAFVLVVSH